MISNERFKALLMGALLGTLCACGDSEGTASAEGGAGEGGAGEGGTLDFSDFDAVMEQFLDDNDLEGATAAVVQKGAGVVHARGYGAFDEDRVFLIASSSKILSAGVLLRLADQGELDLDTPISTYLSDWGEHKTDITVAQMLSNSAGMSGLLDDPTYAPYVCQYIDADTMPSCAEQIYTASDSQTRVPPDTEFRYGGGQWQLAGGVAEVVSGKTWAELVDDTYVQPCGTTSLGYTNQFSRATADGDGFAYPSFFSGEVSDLPMTLNPNIEGGAYIDVGDYAKILDMHLSGGRCGDTRVLSESAVARMQEDRIADEYDGTTPSDQLEGYGLGWWIDRDEPGVLVDGGAYGAQPWLDVPRGYGAVIFLEAESATGSALRLEAKPALDAVFDAQ